MSDKKETESNPVMEIFEGIKIRQRNPVYLNLDQNEMKRLVSAQVLTGNTLSFPQILAAQGAPCQMCGHSNVCLPIPKGILSNKKQSSGSRGKTNSTIDGQSS